jgi:DNA-directed RNA polymerase subunit N (RpoN/RPB10)
MMHDFVTTPCACLNCGKVLDRATPMSDTDGPSPGAITVCLTCGHIMAFADNLAFRELTDEEVKEIAGNRTIIAINKWRDELRSKRH